MLPMIIQHSSCLLASYIGNFYDEVSACSLDLTHTFSSLRDEWAPINEDLEPSEEMERYLDSAMFWIIVMEWPSAIP